MNVCGYTPINLGKIIKEGVLADVPSIHRMTIDRQEVFWNKQKYTMRIIYNPKFLCYSDDMKYRN